GADLEGPQGMAPKPNKHIKRYRKIGKLAALARRPGTTGEGQSALAALERTGATSDDVLLVDLAKATRVRRTGRNQSRQRDLTSKRDRAQAPTKDRLTDGLVRRLKPEARPRITYDAGFGGFGVRVTPNGAKSYVLNYRTKGGRERRITIGGF